MIEFITTLKLYVTCLSFGPERSYWMNLCRWVTLDHRSGWDHQGPWDPSTATSYHLIASNFQDVHMNYSQCLPTIKHRLFLHPTANLRPTTLCAPGKEQDNQRYHRSLQLLDSCKWQRISESGSCPERGGKQKKLRPLSLSLEESFLQPEAERSV